MKKIIFLFFAMALAVVVMADDIPLVYNVENTGANSCPPLMFPAVNELPSIVRLPNPFEWADGHGVISDFSDWECRRSEIMAEIEHYEIGVKPVRPADISATYADGVLTVIVEDNGKTVTLTSRVTMPTGTGPFPVIIGMNSPTGSLSPSFFEGFIQIPFMHDQVAIYDMTGNKNLNSPFYQMYPELSQAGDYCAWAWGVSRLIDGIELVQQDLNADLSHIGVTGCSYAGKMALFAGAFDERIALTIAQESGGGGTASWRVSETLGSVENLGSTNYSWFSPVLRDNFNGQVDKLPYDHHELLAMVAPRALLTLGNDGWTWLADESGYVACMAAREALKALCLEDRFGFDFTGGHNHCVAPESQIAAVTSFVNRFLKGDESINTDITVSPYQNVNYQFWISDWAEVTEPDVPLEQYWYEAESSDCATIGEYVAVQDDVDASGGKYITGKSDPNATVAGLGLLTISFTTNNPRDFHVYARLNRPTGSDNSLWVNIDKGNSIEGYLDNANSEWQWVNIFNPTLLPGPHTITFAFSEDDIKLDRIYITNDPDNIAPTGFGGEETDCVAIPSCFIFDFETGNINGWTKQNPGAGIDITQDDVHSGNYALKMVNGGGTSAWSVQAFTPPVEIVSGHVYNVTFWVRAVGGGGKGRISTTGAGQLGSQYWNDFTVGDSWEKITHTNLTANGNTVQLAFDMGYVANKTYYIDDIVFEDITAVPAPNAKVQATEWNAGKIDVDQTVQSDKFSIRNIGTGILEVTDITTLSTPWTTTLDLGDGLSLGAGQVQEFTFSYSPVAQGTSTVEFNITTNAGNAVIQLMGEGNSTANPFIENQDVKIFSPSPGQLSITASEKATVKINDMLGKTVGTFTIQHSPFLFSLYSGIYIVSVTYNGKTYTQKAVVK